MKYSIAILLLSVSAFACCKKDVPHMAYNHVAKPAYHGVKFAAKQAHKVSKFLVGF